MSEIIQTLRSELDVTTASVQQLETEVTVAQERLRVAADKAERIKALLAVYEAEVEPPKSTANQQVVPEDTPSHKGSRRLSKASQMDHEIANLLSLRGSVHRGQILEHLVQRGIMGHEKKPLAYLAAYLSDHSERFVSDGRGNFSLRRNGNPEPSPAPNGAGSAGVGDTGTTSAHP